MNSTSKTTISRTTARTRCVTSIKKSRMAATVQTTFVTMIVVVVVACSLLSSMLTSSFSSVYFGLIDLGIVHSRTSCYNWQGFLGEPRPGYRRPFFFFACSRLGSPEKACNGLDRRVREPLRPRQTQRRRVERSQAAIGRPRR